MGIHQEQRARERAAGRARRTAGAWRGRAAFRTPHGEVILEEVHRRTDPDSGVEYLDVMAGGEVEGGDPHFRVVNPPLLVADPQGPVEVRGRRFREDPLAALAEAIGSNGGAQARKRRTR